MFTTLCHCCHITHNTFERVYPFVCPAVKPTLFQDMTSLWTPFGLRSLEVLRKESLPFSILETQMYFMRLAKWKHAVAFCYFLLYSLNDIIFYNGNVHFIKWFSLFLCSVMQRYTVSMDFVRKFERQCGSQASVKRLRAHPCYQSFHNKWNLPVYFQLRWVWGLEIQSQLYHSSALSVNVQFFRSIQPGTSVWPICHLHCDIVYIEIKQSIPHQKVQRKRFL